MLIINVNGEQSVVPLGPIRHDKHQKWRLFRKKVINNGPSDLNKLNVKLSNKKSNKRYNVTIIITLRVEVGLKPVSVQYY